jgi:invasion protein IalB
MSQRLAPARRAAGFAAGLMIAAAAVSPVHAQEKAQAKAQQGTQPALVYSPWIKFCLKPEDANATQVCFTATDARIESGEPVAAAVLIEPQKDPKKVLRVTLPLGMQLVHGTRIAIDQSKPAQAAYVICHANGCQSDHALSADMIGRLKKGRTLAIQAINSNGRAVNVNLPLGDFARAYYGPPADTSSLEDRRKKLEQEVQARLGQVREQRLRRERGKGRPN